MSMFGYQPGRHGDSERDWPHVATDEQWEEGRANASVYVTKPFHTPIWDDGTWDCSACDWTYTPGTSERYTVDIETPMTGTEDHPDRVAREHYWKGRV